MYVFNLKKFFLKTMSPHSHKIFKSVLPEDSVCSALGFMLCLYRPQSPTPLPWQGKPGFTAWLRNWV